MSSKKLVRLLFTPPLVTFLDPTVSLGFLFGWVVVVSGLLNWGGIGCRTGGGEESKFGWNACCSPVDGKARSLSNLSIKVDILWLQMTLLLHSKSKCWTTTNPDLGCKCLYFFHDHCDFLFFL